MSRFFFLLLLSVISTSALSWHNGIGVALLATGNSSDYDGGVLLSKYLSQKLNIRTDVMSLTSVDDITKEFLKGDRDIFIGPVTQVIQVCAATGAQMVLEKTITTKSDAKEEEFVMVAADGSSASFNALEGGTIALKSDTSVDGYLLPKFELASVHILLSNKPLATSAKGKILSYQLIPSEETIISMVTTKKVDFGIVRAKALTSGSKLKVIHQFTRIPSQVVAFSKQFESPLTDKLVTTMYQMNDDPLLGRINGSLIQHPLYEPLEKKNQALLNRLATFLADGQ